MNPAPLAPWRTFAGGAIGLWVAPLAELPAAGDDLAAGHDAGEPGARHRHPEARRRALAVRRLARRALAWIDSRHAWKIAHRASGQPYLPDSRLAISLSHSGTRVACAIGRTAALGVDLEAIRPRPRLAAFARRFCSAAELERLEALAGARRRAAFHEIWTLREAWLKATGVGLAGYADCPCTERALAGAVAGWQWARVGDIPGYRLALCWPSSAGGPDRAAPVNSQTAGRAA
ncbi:MAG: 4'-phosphopantetheinyl transferase family protein [Pseudomonadota bacterium]